MQIPKFAPYLAVTVLWVMSPTNEIRLNARETADSGALSHYFSMRLAPGDKPRDHDRDAFFVLLYDDKDRVAGGIRGTCFTAGTRSAHIEERSTVDLKQRISHQFGFNITGSKIAELASVHIEPHYRGGTSAKNLYVEAVASVIERGAELLFVAPYSPNDALIRRMARAKGYEAYDLGKITVKDDNYEVGRQKTLLAIPLSPRMQNAFKTKTSALVSVPT